MTAGKPRVVVSGIRATGRMHLGNYLGVLERFARLSEDPDRKCYFFIADLHTLTTLKEAELIRTHAPNIILDILAAGVNPNRATLYLQSDAPSVTLLTWLLACLAPVGELTGLPTFKDKAEKHREDVNGGLLFYPVLMAADILGPKAEFVPVGRDQRPHLEFTRDLAHKFNRLYGEFFPMPDEMAEEMVTVPGLVLHEHDDDGNVRFGKMGKSEAGTETIYLDETREALEEKILRAPTDPARMRRTDPGTPEKCCIYKLHEFVSSAEEQRWSAEGCRSAGISCVECKKTLVRNVASRLAAFRERRAALAAQPNLVRDILAEGGRQARTVFDETTAIVADRMGITRISG